MSRRPIVARTPADTPRRAPMLQRKCACGGTPGPTGECAACRQRRLAIGGRVGPLLQRQEEGEAAPPVAETGPEPAQEGGEETESAEGEGGADGGGSCTPRALSRANFLAEPHTSTSDFGLTRLDTSQVTYPEVRLRRGRLQPTRAALPTIQSIYTGQGGFTEGTVVVPSGGQCTPGRYPLRWIISRGGAAKIRAGEEEHCADYQHAFDSSLKRYADAVNAGAGRRFGSRGAANRYLRRRTGARPRDWDEIFRCLALKTLTRDVMRWHYPRTRPRAPTYRNPNNCRYGTAVIGARSLPHVGRHATADLIKECDTQAQRQAAYRFLLRRRH